MSLPPPRATRRVPLSFFVSVLVLLGLGGLAFGLRTYFVHDKIFTEGRVLFSVNDCWYHMRLVDNLVRNFPRQNVFDAYALFPTGQAIPVAPLFDWLVALSVRTLAGAQADQRTVDTIAAYFPPVLGTLMLVPVYLLGWRLFGRTAGLLAAAWIAIVPGQLLRRTMLGYTDHHVAEVFFGAVFVLCAVVLVHYARSAKQPDEDTAGRSSRILARLLGLSALTGLALGAYLLSWVGGSLLVGVFTVWLVLQFVLDHLHGRSSNDLLIAISPVFLIALLMVLPYGTILTGFKYHYLALFGALATMLVMAGLAELVRHKEWPRWTYPALLLATGVVGIGLAALVTPELYESVASQFVRFGGEHAKSSIPEAVPLLVGDHGLSLARTWDNFGTGFFIALVGLFVLTYRAVRKDEAPQLLFCIWTFGILAATLGQNRFAYYFAVNVALASAYLGGLYLHAIWSVCLGGADGPSRNAQPRVKSDRGRGKAAKQPGGRETAAPRPIPVGLRYTLLAGGGAVLIAVLYYPNVSLALDKANKANTPDPYWLPALEWMRENTPEPFGDPAAYYALYEPPPYGECYPFPPSAWGVTASWEYGYWITRLAHRIPNANASQKGAAPVSRFFTAQDEAEACTFLDRLRSRYIMIDGTMPFLRYQNGSVQGKLRRIAHWAEKDPSDFVIECYRQVRRGVWQRTYVYRPEYFRSLLVRLYVFRGRPVTVSEAYVVTFEDVVDATGEMVKRISTEQKFTNYADAKAYLDTQPPGSAHLISVEPHLTCVPIETPLTQFRPVYRSQELQAHLYGQLLARLEIYEYLGYREGGSAE